MLRLILVVLCVFTASPSWAWVGGLFRGVGGAATRSVPKFTPLEVPKSYNMAPLDVPKSYNVAPLELPKSYNVAPLEVPNSFNLAPLEMPRVYTAPSLELPKVIEPRSYSIAPIETPKALGVAPLDNQILAPPKVLEVSPPVGIASDLGKEIAKLDILIKENPAIALDRLNVLLGSHGDAPDLLLRKAFVQLEQGRANSAVAILNKIESVPVGDSKTLLNEVSARLRHPKLSASSREDLTEFSRYLAWRNNRNAQQTGYVRAVLHHERFRSEYHMNSSAHPERVTVDELSSLRPDDIIYIQDSPALSNLDWSAGNVKTLQPLVSGGKVYRFSVEGLETFRPTKIYSADGTAVFQRPSASSAETSSRFGQAPRSVHFETQSSSCTQDQQDKSDCFTRRHVIYLVTDGTVRF
jgi:hypothetical protein